MSGCSMGRDSVLMENIVEIPEAGKEYFIWDKVIGPIDADLVGVISVSDGKATIKSLSKINANAFAVDVNAVTWEWDKLGYETDWDAVYVNAISK